MDLNKIEDYEFLYRVVRNSYPDAFVNGKPTAALFMDSDGASVERDGGSAITMNGVKILNQFPSSDVEPVKHGRWEWFEEWSYSTPEHSAECDDCGWRCSECKTKLEDMVNGYYDDSYEVPQLNYCPNCGARMDGE